MSITVASLPTTLRLGLVDLTVSDLDRSIEWYERALGLHVHSREAAVAELGDQQSTLVVLHESPGARRVTETEAGLFHYCLLFPTRKDLARALKRIQDTDSAGTITNMNDRHTHEAIYLDDPDGINIELAWDRPREAWPAVPYGHAPVDLDTAGLLGTIAGEDSQERVDRGLTVGHLHFTFGDLNKSIPFYRDLIGFDLMWHVSSGAFFSVGGYHHQLATNDRKGTDIAPMPEGVIGIRSWTIELEQPGEVSAVRERLEAAGHTVEVIAGGFAVADPAGITVHFVN